MGIPWQLFWGGAKGKRLREACSSGSDSIRSLSLFDEIFFSSFPFPSHVIHITRLESKMLRVSTRSAPRLLLRSSQPRSIWGLAQADPTEPDLTTPLELYEPEPPAKPSTPVKVTTLKNGLKVASADHDLPATSVGVYIATGSAYAPVPGTAHVLKSMAFKTSQNYSATASYRALESMGAIPNVVAGREQMVYQLDMLRENLPEAVSLLADNVLAPKFLPWEIDESKALVKLELDDFSQNHQQLVQELAHTAAYGSASPLGAPLQVPPRMLPHIDANVLEAFVAEQYHPSKMVLTAVGADHDQLVKLAEAHFGAFPGGEPAKQIAATYEGGEVRKSNDDDLSHVGIAFKGCSWKSKDLVPICVLNTLMGGGSSFSAGGPGKGMYTRLYQNVLNRSTVQAASVFTSFYNDCGIFGVYGSTVPYEMGHLVDTLCGEMKKMASSISAEELSRAKNQLKSSLLMNLESRPVLFDDIGRQMLSNGAHTSPLELAARIDAIESKDLLEVAGRIISSTPSIVVVGDTTCVPRHDLIASKCQ